MRRWRIPDKVHLLSPIVTISKSVAFLFDCLVVPLEYKSVLSLSLLRLAFCCCFCFSLFDVSFFFTSSVCVIVHFVRTFVMNMSLLELLEV